MLRLQTTQTFASVALVFLLSAESGCGTWLGNPKDPGKEKPNGNSSVSLTVQGITSASLPLIDSGINVTGVDGSSIGTLTLSEARLVLKSIKLKLEVNDEVERQKFEGPFVVNLLTDEMTPDPGTIAVPDGTYKDIKLQLAVLEKDKVHGAVTDGDPLIERSIYLTGTFIKADGSAHAVTMDFDLDEEFSLRRSNSAFRGMDIVEGQANAVIIAFHLDRWFNFTGREADLNMLDGSAILTKDSGEIEQKVRESIKKNIEASAKFGKDDDGDGKLGGAEASEQD